MRALTIAFLAALALAIPASAATRSRHPTYQHCDRTGHHCVWRRAYWERCGGSWWLVPHRFHVPAGRRDNPAWHAWCSARVPPFVTSS